MDNNDEFKAYDAAPRKSISWRAIFAGTITVLAFLLILNLIGLAIGLGSIEPSEEANPLKGLGTGSIIWWIVSNLIALFAGGYVAARVGVSFSTKSGVIQGFLTWALYCILSVLLVTSAVGSVISGVGSVIGSALSATGNVVAQEVAPRLAERIDELDYNLEKAQEEVKAILRATDKKALKPETLEKKADEVVSEAEKEGKQAVMDPEEAEKEIAQIFQEAKNEFDESFNAVDREALVNVLVERTAMSKSEAERTVDNYLEAYEELRKEAQAFIEQNKEQALENAEEAAEAVAEASVFLAIALILGVVVAVLGGVSGVKNLRHDYRKHRPDVY